MRLFIKCMIIMAALSGLAACSDNVTVTKMIELHLHLDGAISLQSAKQLAQIQNIEIPASDEELLAKMRVSPNCKDLNEFLDKFSFPCSLIQTKEGISLAVYNLCEELKAQNVIYAEIRFAPQKSCDNGLTQEEAVLAAIEGARKSQLRSNLILCCMRGEMTPENDAQNRETIRLARKYLGKGVCAADLAGAESLFRTADYRELFEYAKSLNVPFEMHAGEADGPGSVRDAISFGASRIGHGVRSVEDPALLTELARLGIPLMICPTCEITTCIFKELKDIPIDTFLKAGVPFAIGSDDPSIIGTDLKTEWQNVINTFNLTKGQIRQIMLESVNAAFCSDELRMELRTEINNAYPEK